MPALTPVEHDETGYRGPGPTARSGASVNSLSARSAVRRRSCEVVPAQTCSTCGSAVTGSSMCQVRRPRIALRGSPVVGWWVVPRRRPGTVRSHNRRLPETGGTPRQMPGETSPNDPQRN